MKRFFLFAFLLGTLLIPQPSHAITDTRCWIKEQCLAQRADEDTFHSMTQQEIDEGFVTSTETRAACGEKDALKRDLGFCLPATVAKTKTTFGSQNVFTDIGKFIGLIYRYGIITAGVLAILMIIIAGFIWTTSGGNAERIGSAKKKIAGALMGLLLAVLSYSLLNIINPALVNIRLPQVWKINTQGIAPPYCDQISPPKNLSEIADSINMTQAQRDEASKHVPEKYTVTSTEAICGFSYFVEGANDLLCTGRTCSNQTKNTMCVQYAADTNHNKKIEWRCVDSNLVLSVKLTGLWTLILSTFDGVKKFLETVENHDWVDIENDNPEFWPVCEGANGLYRGKENKNTSWNAVEIIKTKGTSAGINPTLLDYDFIFPKLSLADQDWCNKGNDQQSYDRFKGIFVMIELKESGDLTDPDLWIGQAEPKESNPTEAVVGSWLRPDEIGTGMAFTDYIPKENLEKGVTLNVNVSDKVFQTIEQYTGSNTSRNRMPINIAAEPIKCKTDCTDGEKK